MAPATLDLAERARLAVNGMTEPTDPEADYRVYWKVSFRFNPPAMSHDIGDPGITAKFMESLPRMRIMCGSEQGLHVEERWREVLLHMIGPDGLAATPLEGLPYLRFGFKRTGVFDDEHVIDQQVNGIWPMTTERVGERNIGAFAGWQAPNDWGQFMRVALPEEKAEHFGHVQGIMHCCTGNATRAPYDACRNVVHAEGERVKVNLLLNRCN